MFLILGGLPILERGRLTRVALLLASRVVLVVRVGFVRALIVRVLNDLLLLLLLVLTRVSPALRTQHVLTRVFLFLLLDFLFPIHPQRMQCSYY